MPSDDARGSLPPVTHPTSAEPSGPPGALSGLDGDVAPAHPQAAIDPQKLLRIAGVTREVLEEARRIRPEPVAVEHLQRVHTQIVDELQDALPPELYEELKDLTPSIRSGTLEELSLAHAEILGWLEGLFQGTQLAIQLQAAQAFQDRLRRQLPGGLPRAPESGPSEPEPDSRYL